jgi:alkylation response protein AidB-like acyl-CoA dehydrogenase
MSHDWIKVELDRFLDAEFSPDLSLIEWRKRLVSAGWAAPSWPEDSFGRGFSQAEALVVSRVFADRRIVGAAQVGPRRLAAETILAHGSNEQKQRYLPKILTGEHAWCQLFSEPGSGSDLAGASTRADRKADHWLINGQKVWNQGLSYFLIDMRQPGVEVRPLKQMNGHASFNEVFLTDARVPLDDLMGGEGHGWAVATTTLSIERQGFARGRSQGVPASASAGRIYEELARELEIDNEPYTWYPQREGRPDLILQRAQETGAIEDDAVRQEMAKLFCLTEAARISADRVAAYQKSGGQGVLPAGSIGKLGASVIARQAAHVHTMISGASAMLSGPESAADGLIAETLISVPAGGTDEIQRNIIAERVLGMPKEQRMDTGPFREIPRNAQ